MKMLQNFFREHLLLGLYFVFIYFFFEHGDLDFTARVSMNYYLVNPLHLYDEAVKYAYTGGPGNINYMPSTYLFFAVWGLPLKLLGLADPAQDTGYAIFWYKLLPVIFYFASAIQLKKIANVFLKDERLADKIACLWLVSPFAFFSQFMFGQYDAFTLFFTLCGIHQYLKKDLLRFSIFFGIALTFKYFPAFVFFPMLFAVEKDIKRVIQHSIIFALPVALVCAPYLLINSEEFKLGVLGFSAANRVFGVNVSNGITGFNLIVYLWATLCAYVYFFENRLEDWKEVGIKYGYLGVIILFTLICWHPQWLMFFTPLMILNFMYRENFKRYFMFQMLLNVVGIGAWTHVFGFNVDQNLLTSGVLGKWFPAVWQNVMVCRIGNLFIPHEQKLWISFFNTLLAIGAVFAFRNFKRNSEQVTLQDFEENAELIRNYTLVSVGLFPLLAFGAYFITVYRWRMLHP